jgi:Tfp pilus assembly protein PilN
LLTLSLGLIKTFHNKITYLNRLKSELNRILPEARQIDEMKKKSEVLRAQAFEAIKVIDILSELHQLIPENLILFILIYEEGNQVILRGQSQDLSSVFKSISTLEKSKFFKSAKVRYATRRKTQTGEVIDFEIVCPLKK